MSKKVKDQLYCKMSALKARVKRKREQMWQSQSMNNTSARFTRLAQIIGDELECGCREQVMAFLANKKSRKAGKQSQCTRQGTKILKKDFL